MIKLKNLLEIYKGGIPAVLYHGTFWELTPDIMDHGLVPGGKEVQNYEGNELGVYLTPDKDLAISMVETSDNENIPEQWFDDIVVLSIDINHLNKRLFEKDPHWNPSGKRGTISKSFLYRGIIPPSSIIQMTDCRGNHIKKVSKTDMGL